MEGKLFGKYRVLQRVFNGKPGKHYECICSCGEINIKAGTELRAGRATRCKACMYADLYDPKREIGKKYGRWTIMKYVGMSKNLQRYKTRCACGAEGEHFAAELRANKSNGCRACGDIDMAKTNTKHGQQNRLIYKVWSTMKHRCNNENDEYYHLYGGQGIKVCDSWTKSFIDFSKDMGERPEGMTIERINNDGKYEPSNCKWVPHKENCQNRSYPKNRKSRVKKVEPPKRDIVKEWLQKKWKDVGVYRDYKD